MGVGWTGGAGYLTEGVDFIIEYGTGGQGGDAGWDNWDEMDNATATDLDTSTVWTTDPADVALGGTADPVTGVRDSITKYRIKYLVDMDPNAALQSLVTVEVIGPSTLEFEEAIQLVISSQCMVVIRQTITLDGRQTRTIQEPLQGRILAMTAIV